MRNIKEIVRLLSLVALLAMGNHARAQQCKQHDETCTSNADCCQKQCEAGKCKRIWYNLPTYSKAKIAQNTNGDWFIYVEFMWEDENCGPNFEEGKAVEFQVYVTPKCFLQPKGGKDDKFDCTEVMGRLNIGFNLPNDFVPKAGALNCYVDLWNYWNPPALDVPGLLQSACQYDDNLKASTCATLGTASGKFLDPIGNFTVGLHDASALKAGELYSFRYPVELNNSAACTSTATTFLNGRSCSGTDPLVKEDQQRGYYTPNPIIPGTAEFHDDWGRATITMETFNNQCDLASRCDPSGEKYTCPHLIGLAEDKENGCINVDKYRDYWTNRLCLPTGTPTTTNPKAGDYLFFPGEAQYPNQQKCDENDIEPCCMTEVSSSDLQDHGICCVDQDGDGYYAPQSAKLFGNKVGDCDDHNPDIYPGGGVCLSDNITVPIPPAGIPSEPDPEPMTTSIPPAPTTPPEQEPATTPEPATQPEPVCEPGDVKRQSTVCTDPITSEVVRGMQEMPCTEEGQWRGWWELCTEDPPCSPPDKVETARCTATTVQTRICDYEGLWRNWSECLPGELPEPDPGQNPDPDPGCVCSSGACCNGCNYLPASATCEGWNRYQCVGQDVQGRQAERHCSGSSEQCQGGGGNVEYTDWQYVTTCAANEVCQVLGNGSYECADSGTCTETYMAAPTGACYTNTQSNGGLTMCLEVAQTGGSEWQWRICMETGTFPEDFSLSLLDVNHTDQDVGSTYANTVGNPCSQWHDVSLKYLEAEGFGNRDATAGFEGHVTSPLGCSDPACQYKTGMVSIRRECL